MTFQILRNDQPLMSTDCKSCIYDKETLKEMSKSGFTFKLNGKKTSIKDLIKFIDNE